MRSLPTIWARDIVRLVRQNLLLFVALVVAFVGVLVTCGTEDACVNALGNFACFLPGQGLQPPRRIFLEMVAWFLAIAIAGIHFYMRRVPAEDYQVRSADFAYCLVLCGFASVAYLFDPAHIPLQVTADECYFVELVRKLAADRLADPLGMCVWWHWPSAPFIIYGHASQLLAGISFGTLRFLGALAGLALCPIAYIYFRFIFAPSYACAATMLVMFNHVLIAYSRVAQQHAACVILELVSLILLLVGYRRRCPYFSYLGGVFAGLGFYAYYPSRITIVLWLCFGAGLVLSSGQKRLAKQWLSLLAVTLCGFALTLSAMAVHVLADYDAANKYTRDRIILIPEGMEMQRSHWTYNSDYDAYISNMSRAFITFNSKEYDGWGLYENPYLGFADPILGSFLWIGLIAVSLDVRRKDYKPIELFQAGSFLVNFFILCFIVNIAPSYARLLVSLPFIAFLAVKGMQMLAETVGKLSPALLRTDVFSRILVFGFAGGATAINIWAFSSWVRDGLRDGEDYGSTLRSMMSYSEPHYQFYVLSSKTDMYIPWTRWDEALQTMMRPDQTLTVINAPDNALDALKPMADHRPFTVYMLKSRWDKIADPFKMMFPCSLPHQVTKQPYERVAIDVF
jgi:Dolichyl-phosphate-mannose-protein mannosyltransferase